MPRTHPRQPRLLPRHSRRGSVYVMVLLTAMVLTVIGLSGAIVTRLNFRSAEMGRESGEARLLASTAVEHALATIAATPTWKTVYAGQDLPLPASFNGGTFKWRITDNGDTTYRITGTGTKGGATRVLSARYAASTSLAVLSKPVYAAKNITTSSTTTYIGGRLASGATVTNGSAIVGSVEAPVFINIGTISGTYTPSLPLQLPPATVFDTYKGMATPITYASTGGSITVRLISAASNPYGSTNTNAVYSIDVPALSTLTITKSRIVATLVVTLQTGATLRLQQANLWEKPAGNYPILLVKAVGTGYVDFNGFTQQLSEPNALFNFNPAGTPYAGVSDTDILDTYPTELRGLVHIIGAGAATGAGSNFSLTGALITEGSMTIGSNSKFTLDASLATSPPLGYATGTNPSDWRWEVLP